MDDVTFTEAQLIELCAEWQKRLRLQDWDVALRVCRARDIDFGGVGYCEWVMDHKQALISIIDPEDYTAYGAWPYDMEKTLVHELLHLHVAPFEAGEGPEDIAQEQMIDILARALVDLKRQAN